MTWQKLTRSNYRAQNFLERVSMSINRWPMLFGRYLAENSIFSHIYVRKKFFWGPKIQKNRFFKNRSKSHIYVYNWWKTCLGTPKGHFQAIYTYNCHYLPLYEKLNFWKKSQFSWILAIFDKSKFGRLAGRKWPESWFMVRNIFSRQFRSLFI